MARFVTVEIGCDWADCGTRALEGDPTITPVELSIDRKQGREFLLCLKHREVFDDMVLPLMAAGVKVADGLKRATKSSAPVPADAGIHTNVDSIRCRHEGCGRADIKNRAGLSQHVIRNHGYASLAEYEERNPATT